MSSMRTTTTLGDPGAASTGRIGRAVVSTSSGSRVRSGCSVTRRILAPASRWSAALPHRLALLGEGFETLEAVLGGVEPRHGRERAGGDQVQRLLEAERLGGTR